MAVKGQAITVCFWVEDLAAGGGKSGQAGNLTLRIVSDGTAAAPTNSPVEIDATNLPGLYRLTVTAAENAGATMIVGGKCSTSDVAVRPVQWANEHNTVALDDDLQSLADLKDFGDAGYDPATNRIAGISGTKNTFDDLQDLSSAQAQTAAAAALTTYDPPTRAEATSDKDEVLAAVGGLNDLDAAAVQAAAAAALVAYDPPTRAELTADKDELLAVVNLILGDTGTDGVVISTAQARAIADEILKRSAGAVEDVAGDHSLAALILAGLESSISGSTWSIWKTDGATLFLAKTVATDAAAEPITGVS